MSKRGMETRSKARQKEKERQSQEPPMSAGQQWSGSLNPAEDMSVPPTTFQSDDEDEEPPTISEQNPAEDTSAQPSGPATSDSQNLGMTNVSTAMSSLQVNDIDAVGSWIMLSRTFTVGDMEQYISSFDTMEDRQAAAQSIFATWTNVHEATDQFAISLYDFLKKDSECWRILSDKNSFLEAEQTDLKSLRDASMKGRETQAAKDSAMERIRSLPTPETPGAANWDKKQINALLDHRLSPIVDAENVKNALHPVDAAATNGRDFLRELSLYLQLLHAKHFSWEITFRLLSVTIYKRVIERNKGTRVSCKLTTGDVKKTLAMFKKVNEEYANTGGAKCTDKFVKLAFSPMITDKQWGELIPPLQEHPYFFLPIRRDMVDLWNNMEYDTYKQLAEATRPTSTDNSLDEDDTFSPSTPAPKGTPSVFSPFSPAVTPFSASRNRKTLSPSATVDPNNLPEYADSSRQASEEPDEDSIMVTSLRTDRARGQLCNCSLKFDKKALSFQKMVESGSKFKTVAARHMHAKALVAYMVNLTKEQWNICYRHAKLGASQVGLQVRTGRTHILLSRLQEFGNALNGSTFVVHANYSNWFRLHARPPVPSDLLEIYAYRPTNSAGYNGTPVLNPVVLKTLRDRILTKKKQSDWTEDGSILSGDEFSYWGHGHQNFDEAFKDLEPNKFLLDFKSQNNWTIKDMVILESTMYKYHQRRIRDHSNLGWNRTMYHGLGQQVMRQSIRYWRLYVSLRPDGRFWLISYPYYAKHTEPKDMTGFMHIDVNLYRACNENIGVDAIQGSLTITGEDNKNCTRIIPKMNDTSKTLEWIEMMTKRGVKIGKGFITGMKPDVHWTAAEVKAFDTDWTDVVCQDLQVRVTHSLIPHGSNGPATRERITMLPWLCGIQEDHETLEMAEGGSWNEISAAHRDLCAGPATPSGLSVNYGRIPYSFPASVHYNLSNPVAAALVGRAKWSCGSVATEAHKIITDNKYGREACKAQEDEVVATFAPKFREMIALERHIFGKNSFFNVMCDTRTADGIRPEPTMDEGNDEGQDLNDIQGAVEMLGAEASESVQRSVYDAV